MRAVVAWQWYKSVYFMHADSEIKQREESVLYFIRVKDTIYSEQPGQFCRSSRFTYAFH